MYNDAIKRQFLKEIDVHGRTQSIYEGEFNRVAPFEESLGKDLCEFTADEFAKVLDSVSGTMFHGRRTKFSNMMRYVRWVRDSGITQLHPNESLFLISGNALARSTSKIAKSFIKDPQHLKNILDAIDSYNEVSSDYMGTNKIRRVFAWLMYSGLAQEDIVKIKEENVDLKHGYIVYQSDLYPIYYLAQQDFRDLMAMTDLSYKKTSKKIIIQCPRAKGDLLLRGEVNPTFKSLYNNFAMNITAAAKTNPVIIPLPFRRVHMSGIFYDAYLEEVETGIKPRFAVQAARELEKTTKDWDAMDDTTKRDRVYKQSMNMRADYKRWKEAFDLIDE